MRIIITAINEKGYIIKKDSSQQIHEIKPEIVYNGYDAIKLIEKMIENNEVENISIYINRNFNKEIKVKEEKIQDVQEL